MRMTQLEGGHEQEQPDEHVDRSGVARAGRAEQWQQGDRHRQEKKEPHEAAIARYRTADARSFHRLGRKGKGEGAGRTEGSQARG